MELARDANAFLAWELPLVGADVRAACAGRGLDGHVVVSPNGRVMAFVIHGRDAASRNYWRVNWIAVAEERAGRGVGRTLLETSESTARAAGVGFVTVETGSADRFAGARRLYAKAGYRKIGSLPAYFAIDDDKVIFVKSLT